MQPITILKAYICPCRYYKFGLEWWQISTDVRSVFKQLDGLCIDLKRMINACRVIKSTLNFTAPYISRSAKTLLRVFYFSTMTCLESFILLRDIIALVTINGGERIWSHLSLIVKQLIIHKLLIFLFNN